MKKVTFAISVLSGLILLGCSSGGGGGGGGGYTPPAPTPPSPTPPASPTPPTPTPPASNPSVVVEVDSSESSKKLSGVAGKKIFLATVNTGDALIPSSDVRYVTSTDPDISGGASSDFAFDFSSPYPDPEDMIWHCGSEKYNSLLPVAGSPAGSPADRDISFDAEPPTDYEVGDSKDMIVDVSTNTYETRSSTCKAVGSYCYVWFVDDADVFGTATVTDEMAQSIADKFDEMYPIIREAFGAEADQLITASNGRPEMATTSATKTMVNLLVFDIPLDSVMGYFSSNDFYTADTVFIGLGKISNAGKYLYIDSEYLETDMDETANTLAHEFQHLINFSKKYVEKNLGRTSSPYNEMLSMVCEDMMLDHFGRSHGESMLNTRLIRFKARYFYSGITEWNKSDDVSDSYSASYAFGAWLFRQYGGAKLAKEMLSNNYIDNESIVAAVNTVNGTDLTMDDLIKQFILALTGDSTYTMKKAAAQAITSSSGYKYPMVGLNMFTDTQSMQVTYPYPAGSLNLSIGFYGPAVFGAGAGFPYDIRPKNGISLQYLGIVPSGTSDVTVYFTGDAEENTKTYLIAQ